MAFRTNKVPAIEERTVSGSSVSFHSNFALPLKACKVSFSATQAGSGDPSPSNPRAISGVSAIGLTANSTPVSVSLGDTRYGGELDLLTGELVLTHQKVILNGTQDIVLANWRPTATSVTWCYVPSVTPDFDYNSNPMCDILESVSYGAIYVGNNDYQCAFYNHDTPYGLFIRYGDTSLSTKEAINEFLSNNPIEIIYPLATPITIQLSANELSSIVGNNTFSTDTGTLEITFSDLQEKSASGSIATFNTALAMPLASCNIAVNAWQEGSGDPSPDNVRPIHGFSEVNAISGASVNLCPFNNDIDFTKNNIRYYTQDGNLYLNGTSTGETASYDNVFKNNLDFYLPAGTYTLSRTVGSIYVYKINDDSTVTQLAKISSPTFTITETTHCFVGFYVYQNTYNNVMSGVQVNRGSSALPYEPCSPKTTYTIQLGQEVYGAEVDVVNGVAHVTHGFVVFDGSEDWGEYGSAGFQSGVYSSLKLGNRQEGMANWLITTGTVNQFGFIIGLNNKKFYATHIKENISEVIDVTSWKQYLGEHPLQVVYPLAEPFDIQLTPQQIETLIGNNTIFADTGDVDLTYKDLDIAKRGSFREVFKLP